MEGIMAALEEGAAAEGSAYAQWCTETLAMLRKACPHVPEGKKKKEPLK